MVQAIKTPQYSPSEYLEQEIASSERHEFIDGDIVLMTGGTPNHNRIAGNLLMELKIALKRQPYEVFVADQRLWIPQANIYTYPDVMVMAEPLEMATNRTDTVVNPIMVAEVLSKSTQNYDHVEKFAAYRTIERLQEYVLLDQYSYHVEQYVKTAPNRWLFIEYVGLDAVVDLNALDVQVSMADLYTKVDMAKGHSPRTKE